MMDNPPRSHLRTARELPRYLTDVTELAAEAPLPPPVSAAAQAAIEAAIAGQHTVRRRHRLAPPGARTARDRWRR